MTHILSCLVEHVTDVRVEQQTSHKSK